MATDPKCDCVMILGKEAGFAPLVGKGAPVTGFGDEA
jgi:hypothetical protein